MHPLHTGGPILPDDGERVDFLRSLRILDTQSDSRFDRITEAASTITHSPIVLVSLVDGDRLWFKSKVGLDASEASRDSAFCSRVVAEPGSEIFVVCDAAEDERFKYSDLVLGEPFIRFYAGAPLIVPADNGKEYKIGSLCVIDRKPRELERYYYPVMQSLAQLVVAEVDRLRQNVSSFKSSDCTHMKVFVHIFVISAFRKPIRFVAVGHPSMATAGDARHPARPMRARRGADAARGRGYLAGHPPPARCLPRSLPPPQRHGRRAATAAAAHMR